MTTLILFLMLGGFVFVEQDLPIEERWEWRGEATVNFRSADLDGDGHKDLLFDNQVCFQRDGGFPMNARKLVPGMEESARVDAFGNLLYVRFDDRLDRCRWENDAWQTVHSQPIAWPAPAPDEQIDYSFGWRTDGRKNVCLERSLEDVDGDGTPEIVLPAEDGLHVYRQTDGNYAEIARWDVFPALRVMAGGQPLWPLKTRHLYYPSRYVGFRYVISGNRVMVLSEEPWSDNEGKRRYRAKHYVIDTANGFAAVPDAALPEEVSVPLASWSIQPRRLNNGLHLGFAGSEWRGSGASVVPAPLLETRASTDDGRNMQTVRTQSFGWRFPFVDVNEDGRVDMITSTTDLFQGGIREAVNRFVSGRDIEDEVRIFLQQPDGTFSKMPDVTGRFKIRLDKPSLMRSGIYSRYTSGGCYDLRGDFNKDGLHDMAVADRPDRISIFLCTGKTFAETPTGVVQIHDGASFGVRDVDGDGRGDFLVRWTEGEGEKYITHSLVYLTREGPP